MRSLRLAAGPRGRRGLGAMAGIAGLLGALATPVAEAQGDREIGRFQEPAEERRIETPGGGQGRGAQKAPDGSAVRAPENLEQRTYLRERSDAVARLGREYRDERIEKMLEQREELVRVRRGQAIELLEQFIREEPDDVPEMPDALLRLAELRWESARAEYLEAFGNWQKVPERNRGPKPQPQYAPAMQLYDRILDDFPDFDRYDLVLYMKAYAHVERGEMERALGHYQRIIDEHPGSRFVPDAHFALGEAAFSGNYDYRAALRQYEKVLDYPESALADIALFKSAWCMWRMGQNKKAATRFRRVLDLGQRRDELSGAQRRRLRELQNEALDYLIQVFTEDPNNTASDVFDFLEEIGGERYAHRVLERLSDTYMGQARYSRAVEAYGLLLEMDGSVAEAPKYQREIARAYSYMGDEDKTFEALRALAAQYGKGSKWARQQGDPRVVREARSLAEQALRKQALTYHEIGQKEDQDGPLENAARLYDAYLEHFPESEQAYELQFYLAEILFHRLEKWPEAGDAYLAAARLEPEGDFTRDALYNAIGAFERVREQEIEDCVKQPEGEGAPGASGGGASGAACGETENDRKFSEAIEMYVELYPNDPDLPEILFRQGRLYHDRGVYDPAVRLFGQLLERFPDSEYAAPAGELILDSFNKADDYQNIEKWARRLKKAPAFQSEKEQRRLNKLIIQSMFKVGEQLAEEGAHGKAAKAYFRAAEEFPRHEKAAEAYYNAGLEWQRSGDLKGASDAYDRLIERHPDTEVGAKGAWAAAQMYESIALFRDAARYYERYYEGFSKGKKRGDALYNAVLLRVTAGDYDRAVQDGRAFVESFPRDDSVDDVYFFIGRAYEGAEQWEQAARTYRRYVSRTRDTDRKVEAQTRLGEVLLEGGNEKGADRAFAQAVKLGRRHKSGLNDGLYYAAQARYLQGDLILRRYAAVDIKGPVAGLEQRLERKSQLLKEAATVYADVVDFGVAEWVSAALYQIGRSYELFAEAMREAPIPEDLSEEQEQEYRNGLAMYIVPMEERALEAYEGGYRKALEMRIFNTWTQKLREALTRLNDIEYPPLREIGGEIVETAPLPQARPLEALEPRSGDEDGRQGR